MVTMAKENIMRRKMQKGLSLLLSATMAFGVAATPVAAAEETGVPEGGAGVTAALPAEDMPRSCLWRILIYISRAICMQLLPLIIFCPL